MYYNNDCLKRAVCSSCNKRVSRFYNMSLRLRSSVYGGVPEWPKGTDCKSAASSFGGSNPSPPTSTRDCFAAVSFFILFFYSFHFAPYILGVLGCPREALFLLFTLQQDFDSRSALLLVVKVVFVVFHTQSSICAT